MVDILRVKVKWTGGPGGPGFTNFHFNEFVEGDQTQANADGAVSKTDAFISNWQSSLPTSITIAVDPIVDVITAEDGKLKSFFTTAPAAARVGTGTGAYSAASGMCFNWYTNGVRNGRRVRGRTFVVPIAGNAMDTNGTIDNTKVTGLRTVAATFISSTGSGDFGVYSRPSAPGATDGVWYPATSFTLPDKVAVLRSRRD